MAKEAAEKKPAKREEHGGADGNGGEKKPKKHLHQIIHTFAHDGSASHEHVYKDHKDDHHTHPPKFMGTSQNIEDLMQHDQDHAGPMMAGGEGEGEGDESEEAAENEGGEGGGQQEA